MHFPILFCKCDNSAPSPINLDWITHKDSGKRKIPRHEMTKTEIFSQNLEPGELQTLPIIKHATVKHGSGIIILWGCFAAAVTGWPVQVEAMSLKIVHTTWDWDMRSTWQWKGGFWMSMIVLKFLRTKKKKIKPSTTFLEKHVASLFTCVWNNFIGKGEEPAQFQMCKACRDLCKKTWAQSSQRKYTKFHFQFLKILRVCFYFVGKVQ